MLVQRPKQFSSELSSFTYLIHNVFLCRCKRKKEKKKKEQKEEKNKNKRKASKADTEPDSERIREV